MFSRISKARESLLRWKRGYFSPYKQSFQSPECVNIVYDGGNTALHFAAKEGRHADVKKLLEFNADIHRQNNDGYDALMLAALHGHSRTVKLLLSAGADVFARNGRGCTAEDIAVEHMRLDICKLISRNRANIERKQASRVGMSVSGDLNSLKQSVEIDRVVGRVTENRHQIRQDDNRHQIRQDDNRHQIRQDENRHQIRQDDNRHQIRQDDNRHQIRQDDNRHQIRQDENRHQIRQDDNRHQIRQDENRHQIRQDENRHQIRQDENRHQIRQDENIHQIRQDENIHQIRQDENRHQIRQASAFRDTAKVSASSHSGSGGDSARTLSKTNNVRCNNGIVSDKIVKGGDITNKLSNYAGIDGEIVDGLLLETDATRNKRVENRADRTSNKSKSDKASLLAQPKSKIETKHSVQSEDETEDKYYIVISTKHTEVKTNNVQSDAITEVKPNASFPSCKASYLSVRHYTYVIPSRMARWEKNSTQNKLMTDSKLTQTDPSTTDVHAVSHSRISCASTSSKGESPENVGSIPEAVSSPRTVHRSCSYPVIAEKLCSKSDSDIGKQVVSNKEVMQNMSKALAKLPAYQVSRYSCPDLRNLLNDLPLRTCIYITNNIKGKKVNVAVDRSSISDNEGNETTDF